MSATKGDGGSRKKETQKEALLKLVGPENAARRRALLEGHIRVLEGHIPPPETPDVTLLENGPGRDPVAVVSGEVLVAAPDSDDRSLQLTELLAGLHFREEDRLVGDVLRFVPTEGAEADIAEAIHAAREAEFTAGPNHILPLNWKMKGKSGPENADIDLPPRQSGDLQPLVVAIDTGKASPARLNRDDGWLDDLTGDLDPLDMPPDDDDTYLDLGAGHGTFVAGIVRQVAPDARVHVLRALGPYGIGTEVEVAEQIWDAKAFIEGNGARGAINLSLGESTLGDEEPVILKPAIDAVSSMPGVAVVAAAGNSGDSHPHWPAAFESVIAVAGLERDLKEARWSTRGKWVEFSTVGEDLVSTFVVGDERPGSNDDADPYDLHPDQWSGRNPNAVWLGTSFAAPQVAAWLARYLAEYAGDSVEDAKEALRQGAKKELPHWGYLVAIAPFSSTVPS